MEVALVVNRLCRFLATLGPIGLLPAPGTCGTLCAIPLVYVLKRSELLCGCYLDRFVTLGLIVVGWWIIDRALRTFGWDQQDPQVIVLDEVVGFCVATFGLRWDPIVLILAFLYFRFFDIVKPFGLKLLERVPGATGVLADDIAAGVLAHLFTSWTISFVAWFFKISGYV